MRQEYKVYKQRGSSKNRVMFFLVLFLILGASAYVYIRFNHFINGDNQLSYSSTKVNLTKQYSVPGYIYFVKNKNLWTATDGQVKQITQSGNITMPAISPDNNKIIYPMMQLNYSNLEYANINGGTIKTIKDNSHYYMWNVDPYFSPDGNKIAYLSDAAKNTSGVYDLGVWIYNLSTHANVQLADAYPYTGGDADIFWPSSNPDYVMYTKYMYFTNDPVIHPQIMITNTKTEKDYAVTPQSSNTFQGTVSPDGNWMAFIKRENGQDNLYVMPFNIDNITTTPYTQDNPDYAKAIKIETGTNAQPVFAPLSLSKTNQYLLAYINLNSNSFELSTLELNYNSKKDQLDKGKSYQITEQSQIDSSSHLYWTK